MKKIFTLLFSIATLLTAQAQTNHLVISQVYGGGGNSGAPYTNDFIEIFNPSGSAIVINDWSIQYASASGSTWSVVILPATTIQPGQYYLVQLAGGANGAALPTADATGTINMSATNGKVALVNNSATLSGSCPTGLVDFVGFGTANCFEGTNATVAGSNTTSLVRKNGGCTDTDNNNADFESSTPTPRNTTAAFNVCGTVNPPTCTAPTQSASRLRLAATSGTNLSLLFTRGNGNGALVICKANSAVNSNPVTGTTYNANTVFGSGDQLGSGNFAVYDTKLSGVIGVTITGLTAGTKYYFAVYEYADPGKCYLSTPLVDSFTAGSTILLPGDMMFTGWDNSAAGSGNDQLYFATLVDITKGTEFSLVNSRFEAGAPANVRTNHWGGGGDEPYTDPYVQRIEYAGPTIPKGSIIACQSSASNFTNFTINGVASTDFKILSGFSNFLNVGQPDQVYIVQGKFTSTGVNGVDRHGILDGHVIHGMSVGKAWIPFSDVVSDDNSGGNQNRVSRIPPDILCFSVELPTQDGFGHYTRTNGQTGTKKELLSLIRNTSNWAIGTGAASTDDALASDPSIASAAYTVNASSADGNWTGLSSNDWFDCANWQGLHVPDSSLNSIVNALPTAANDCNINVAASTLAPQYLSVARTNAISILPNAVVSLTGSGSDKLIAEDDITIQNGGTLQFENNGNALTDTIVAHHSISDADSPGFIGGMGTVELAETRFNPFTAVVSRPGQFATIFYNLAINNSRSHGILNQTLVKNNLHLQNGYLNVIDPTGHLMLQFTGTISSPANIYGFINRGYQKSFVNGKFHFQTVGTNADITLPIGKITATDTLYAPVQLTKMNNITDTVTAEYFPVPYSDLTYDIAHLHHVSKVEYWNIVSSTNQLDAKVGLSWRPFSEVGDGTPAHDQEALDSLVVTHYFDDGSGTPMWRLDGADHNIMPKSNPSNVNYGTVTTNIATGLFNAANPFTLGTKSPYNSLPLRLISFIASPSGNNIDVVWQTSNEQNLKLYDLEKSSNGTDFEKFDGRSAVNNPINNYKITDNEPVNGWNYYRLKIIDVRSNTVYSYIVKAWVGKTAQILVYPNPAQKELYINLPVSGNKTEIVIVNTSGQIVKKQAISNLFTSINVESLSKGVYYIKILNNQQTTIQRFIKL